MPVKLTSYFSIVQQPRTVGWSETIILDYAGLAVAAQAIGGQGGYLRLRCNLLGAGAVNNYNRLSVAAAGEPPAPPRRSQYVPLPGLAPTIELGTLPYYLQATKTAPADFTQNVFMLRMTTDPGQAPQYLRSFWLAGIPDVSTGTDQPRPLPGAWQDAYTAWVNFLKGIPANGRTPATAGKLLLEVEDRGNTNQLKGCSAYNPATNVYTVTGHGFQDGHFITAVGFRGNPGATLPRGRYQVEVVDANSIKLKDADQMLNETVFGGFRKHLLAYPPVTGIGERGFTNKKKGRPFGLLRGRRLTQTRSQA